MTQQASSFPVAPVQAPCFTPQAVGRARTGWRARGSALICAALLAACATAPDAPDATDVVVPPSMLSMQVSYPDAARRQGQQGRVQLRLAHDATGTVTNARVEQSSGSPILDSAAVDAAPSFRIRPGTRNGVPQAGVLVQAVNFRLTDSQTTPTPTPTPK